MNTEESFYWEQHPKIEIVFNEMLEKFKRENSDILALAIKMEKSTSTTMLSWADHIVLYYSKAIEKKLTELGFFKENDSEFKVYVHSGVNLPAVLLVESSSNLKTGLALKVESVSKFLQLNGFTAEIEGKPFGSYRRSCISTQKNTSLYIVERRGSRTYIPDYPTDKQRDDYLAGVELWRRIPRTFTDEDKALNVIIQVSDTLVAKVGRDMAAHIVCLGEREYWLSKNYAGRIQKMRQDVLGLGWANHDHHTFRSSRKNFTKVVEFFAKLGFKKREHFYAGEQAGWGAQVMENVNAGLALFLDVDLAPDEVAVDFASQELREKDELGTVGLWCALPGDSILNAGMHHLAANFIFDRLTKDIKEFGVEFMAPFSDFDYLKQAFSKGENWQVNPAKVSELLVRKAIDNRKAESFLENGAIGSHLENIQRRKGYKGFNKKNVSAIIKETDPRTYE